jgi:hypothetical protein
MQNSTLKKGEKSKNPKDILYIYLIMSKQQTLQSIKSTVGSFPPGCEGAFVWLKGTGTGHGG